VVTHLPQSGYKRPFLETVFPQVARRIMQICIHTFGFDAKWTIGKAFSFKSITNNWFSGK
jgi:hypothetical protein